MTLKWEELDNRAVANAKVLAADAVENAGNGHPGAAISLAPLAYLLFQRHLRFDPTDSHWLGRDKFVLSIGHSSLTQYVQLFLAGQGLEVDDLKNFRRFGSNTPGHPELGVTAGVEISTGPLASGVASAVGMAMSNRRVRGMFDPQAPHGESPFDHYVYSIVGEGCLEEGLSSEACSLAGTQKLGNLIVFYDENLISIEDDTNIAFSEDVSKRFEAYGWHTQRVDWLGDGNYHEDVEAVHEAIGNAKKVTDQPSLISIRTLIGWPTPKKTNTGAIHGSALGPEALRGLKEILGFNPDQLFEIDEEAVAHARNNAKLRAQENRANWDKAFSLWKQNHPENAQLLDRILSGKLPDGLEEALPKFAAGTSLATRAASGQVINALAPLMPEFWGGSADLAGSNNTLIKGETSFLPLERGSKMFKADPYGRNLHFGVREHGMGAIANGIALDGFTRPYIGTFFVFSDYMRGSVRLAALMDLPLIYVWTHDSIGVGEDGPTHQPVEHLTAYRAIPNLSIVRPMDANETSWAWLEALRRGKPTGIILSRQNLPILDRESPEGIAPASGLTKGAYVVKDCEGTPDVILIATGSEVQLALGAAEKMTAKVRVVSMPCMEWFDEQDTEYQESVLPSSVTARVSIEAGLKMPWYKYLGAKGKAISLETFGEPGNGEFLFEHFGFTVDNVIKTAEEVMGETK